MLPTILDLSSLRAAYQSGLTPLDAIEEVIARRAASKDPAIFITPVPDDELRAAAKALMARAPEANSLPLWGVPFAVKDNIDAAGLPTTAACPAYAYRPEADSTVVARLKAAGAIIIGKTNLDQFATGLNGTRSPYGAPRSVFDAAYISGGSSSGSAVTVASGLAAFALGTDTAGSGRVPAAFNNLVGIKPTPGLLPNTGALPACKSVDCITIFAATVGDGVTIRKVAEGFDAADAFSRRAKPANLPVSGLRIGVLADAEREFFGDKEVEALYDQAIERARGLGAIIVAFDYAPFREAAALLYDGPWVAERLAAVETFLATNAADFDPTVRGLSKAPRARPRSRLSTADIGWKNCVARPKPNGKRPTCFCCRPHRPPIRSPTCWPIPSCSTAASAATPISSTCSIARRLPFRPASEKVGCRAALPLSHLPSPTMRWRRLPMRCTAQQVPAWASTGRLRSPKQAVLCLAMTVSSRSRSSVRI